MPVRLYVKVNGGADRREVSVTSSSCMCNVDKLRLANTARSDVSRTHNFFYDLMFGPRLVHYVHTIGTVSHCRLLLLLFFHTLLLAFA